MATPLETCLGISGSFEGGTGGPRYTTVTGNFDGCGISCGCLQWNAGQGTLQHLLSLTLGGYPVADDPFAPLFALKDMTPPQAVAYAIEQWVDPASANKNLTAEAKALWQQLLGTEQCVAAQNQLAQGILDNALAEAGCFLPWMADVTDNLRVAAFFFDTHVQQGSLSKKQKDGSHLPTPLDSADQAEPNRAVDQAAAQGRAKTAAAWQAALDAGDDLAKVLLHYAYQRAILANPDYVWDTLSRRGTIAARKGQVHGAWFDFTEVLP